MKFGIAVKKLLIISMISLGLAGSGIAMQEPAQQGFLQRMYSWWKRGKEQVQKQYGEYQESQAKAKASREAHAKKRLMNLDFTLYAFPIVRDRAGKLHVLVRENDEPFSTTVLYRPTLRLPCMTFPQADSRALFSWDPNTFLSANDAFFFRIKRAGDKFIGEKIAFVNNDFVKQFEQDLIKYKLSEVTFRLRSFWRDPYSNAAERLSRCAWMDRLGRIVFINSDDFGDSEGRVVLAATVLKNQEISFFGGRALYAGSKDMYAGAGYIDVDENHPSAENIIAFLPVKLLDFTDPRAENLKAADGRKLHWRWLPVDEVISSKESTNQAWKKLFTRYWPDAKANTTWIESFRIYNWKD
jgi:hypothetical protein